MSNKEILKIEHLKKYFKVGKKQGQPVFLKAVDDINLSVYEGETFGLVGESGSGKSTTAYTVIGMYRPTSGKIYYKGMDISFEAAKRPQSLKKDMQIVFQDPGSSLNPRQTIKQILELPLRLHRKIRGKDIEQTVIELLQKVELPPEYMFKSPPAIGGGEKQMVAIARALASAPSFIVLDEPTSALDVSIQAKIINKIMDLQKEMGLTYLFITHDLSLMRNVANRVAIMYLGKICELASATEFYKKPLHPYTRMLLASIPVVSDAEEELKPRKIASTGEIPSPVNVPPGCGFHPRCPEKAKVCSEVVPEMVEVEPGHFVSCHQFSAKFADFWKQS